MQLFSFILFSFVLIQTVLGNPSLLTSNDNIGNNDLSCPPGYSQPDNSNWTMCYKVNTDYRSKYEASQQCLSFSKGTLVSVPNAFVNSYLYSLAKSALATSLWLGIECANGNITGCVNDDGYPFVYSNFNKGEPNAAEQCVYISAIGKDSQTWSTFDCEQGFAYACEAKVQQNSVHCPQGYDSFNGTCYQFVKSSQRISGNTASSLCAQTPGGNLASAASDQVNNFLLTKQHGGSLYSAFGLICQNIEFNGDRMGCYWNDGTAFGPYESFEGPSMPGKGSGGFCEWNLGDWGNCHPPDQVQFDSYICQAPMQ